VIDLVNIAGLGILFLSLVWVWADDIQQIHRTGGRSVPHAGTALFLLSSFSIWLGVSATLRSLRNIAKCEKCGRRFVPPQEATARILCPRCGLSRIVGPQQVGKDLSSAFWTVLSFIVPGVLLLVLLVDELIHSRFGVTDCIVTRFGVACAFALVLVVAGMIQALLASLIVLIIFMRVRM
jgi:DNA-directed RNA polymerase subunit RPC12/RpoP